MGTQEQKCEKQCNGCINFEKEYYISQNQEKKEHGKNCKDLLTCCDQCKMNFVKWMELENKKGF